MITYEGVALSQQEKQLLTSTLRASSHPLSRSLYNLLDKNNIQTLDEFEEERYLPSSEEDGGPGPDDTVH